MPLQTPIAFFVYRRPQLTRAVFSEIARAKPARLLLIADGPRSADEEKRCAAVRSVLKRIDWDCELATNLSDANLGCRQRVASGLDWVFEQTDRAIILEDDCLPHPSFFGYCECLLERYADDARIMSIAGVNYQDGTRRGAYSYYFSKYAHCWGWATWRRAWRHYDVDMRAWPAFRDAGGMAAYCPDPLEHAYWTARFDEMYEHAIDTWDYAWTFARWSRNGLGVIPNVNLVRNIGFGPDATHTVAAQQRQALPLADIGELTHPPRVLRDVEADTYTFERHFGGQRMRAARRWHRRLARRIKGVSARLRRLLGTRGS